MAKSAGRPPRSNSDVFEYRSKIAEHALKLYRAEGFDAVSMRRLAKEVGCAPMTIYAHFDGKTDILRYLWADVLEDMSANIQTALRPVADPKGRLAIAAHNFVSYWIDYPEHFRLVFMSADVSREDVGVFLRDQKTLAHFDLFEGLFQAALPEDADAKLASDALIAGLIGIALCANTIRDYPWSTVSKMVDQLLLNTIC